MKSEWEFASRKDYEAYLRIYFAGVAMQALATNQPISSLTDFADIASDAVQFADALIEALNKDTK